MKALIVEEVVYGDGVLAYVHHHTFPVKRLVIPEAGNLVVTVHNGEVHILDGFDRLQECKILEEVDVSDDFVARAKKFVKVRKTLLEEAVALLGKEEVEE